MFTLASLLTCVAVSLSAALPQGEPASTAVPTVLRRAMLPQNTVVDPARHEVDEVVVKFAEGTGVRLRNGELQSASTDVAPVRAVLGTRRVRRFFTASDDELAALHARAVANAPVGAAPPADLALYHLVDTAGAEDSARLLAALHALAVVEVAYPKERPMPPPGAGAAPAPGDLPPVTPYLAQSQGYHAPPPNGVHAAGARQLLGGWGEDVRVLDIEWGWHFDHEDLAALRPGSLRGPPIGHHSFDDHGTAVGGELVADPDAYGVTGLVPDIEFLCVTNYPVTGYSVANAIVIAMPHLRAGDVMLLEAQTSTPLGLGPTEWNQADFDAIRNATLAGVIVVEAGGNGGANLDAPQFNRAFDVTFRDSGAIIVGATAGASRSAAAFSAFGSRIDANGWGDAVVSTGYGDLLRVGNDQRQEYTGVFGGTSAASPMVTAAVVALLGASRAQWSPQRAATLDWRAVRSLLRATGTAMSPGNRRAIGRRPDLLELLRAAGLQRGLELTAPVQLGGTLSLELDPEHGVAGDTWALLAGLTPANVALPGFAASADRLLLELSQAFVVGSGTFGAGPLTMQFGVPFDRSLQGGRLYLQGLVARAVPDRWLVAVTGPAARTAAAATWDAARHAVLLFGGSDAQGVVLDDTWERRGAAWQQHAPVVRPPARQHAGIAHDRSRNGTVLFGGTDAQQTFLADTWIWREGTWMRAQPAASPLARSGHAMTFDAVRREVVLFGGIGETLFGDTWRWDGTTWTIAAPANAPSARTDAALAFHAASGRVVLFGGRDASGTALGDTWAWDGSTWTQLAPRTSPPARFAHALASDELRGRLVLFGGTTPASGALGDTWEWDGTSWTRVANGSGPSPRSGHVLAHDAARGRTVLFGGAVGGGVRNDAWEWDGGAVFSLTAGCTAFVLEQQQW